MQKEVHKFVSVTLRIWAAGLGSPFFGESSGEGGGGEGASDGGGRGGGAGGSAESAWG